MKFNIISKTLCFILLIKCPHFVIFSFCVCRFVALFYGLCAGQTSLGPSAKWSSSYSDLQYTLSLH